MYYDYRCYFIVNMMLQIDICMVIELFKTVLSRNIMQFQISSWTEIR